jgi:hypothetical protein
MKSTMKGATKRRIIRTLIIIGAIILGWMTTPKVDMDKEIVPHTVAYYRMPRYGE